MSSPQSILPPTTPLGVEPQGLSIWRQTDWQQSLEAGFQQAFGVNAQLDAQTVNGQIINIFAERFALLTELLEGIYDAQYPNGAEGVAVDNQLAIVGLTRKPATATTTAPGQITLSNGVIQYPLVLLGTPGTVVPEGTLLGDSASPPNSFALNAGVTIAAAANAQQALLFSGTPNGGNFALTLGLVSGASVTTAAIDFRALPQQTLLLFAADDDYTYTLSANGATTSSLQGNGDPSLVAGALNQALGVSTITAGAGSLGTVINWPTGPIPTVTASGQGAPTVIDAIQASINQATVNAAQPFSDVAVTGSGQTLLLSFGANAPQGSNAATSGQQVPAVAIAGNTLLANTTSVNIGINIVAQGQPAQGIGAATCTTTGAISVPAGALASVLTPLQGLSSVSNPLPCVTGQALESDSAALQRRATQLSASAQGPLAALLQRVQSLSGVTNALAFSNNTNAAEQQIVFAQAPTQGSYQLVMSTGTTAALSFGALAADMQAAIQALPEMTPVTVTGTSAFGFRIKFNGAQGGQAQPLTQIIGNTTNASARGFYGRYPHSLEVVVSGGDPTQIAEQIYASAPAGYATYGAPVARLSVNTVAGSPIVAVSSATNLAPGQTIDARSIPKGASIVSIAGTNVTLSANALQTLSAQPATAGYAPVVLDSNGNQLVVRFSRPQSVPIFVQVQALTDAYLQAGVPSSGANPSAKWSPNSVATIQADIVACLDLVPIGGTVIGLGTNGVRACISEVPGLIEYEVYFSLVPNATNIAPIALLESQALAVDAFNVQVSWT